MATELMRLEFDLGPNEASGLETFFEQRVLGEHDWDLAFWAVLDDVDVHDAIGVLGHRNDQPLDRGWEVERLKATAHDGLEKTEDAEAVTAHAGHVYVFGSHYGSKDGPLQAKRQFVARFREADVHDAFAGDPIRLEVRRTGLADGLHRVVNDALAERNLALIQPGPNVRAAFLDPDDVDGPDPVMRPEDGDHPINIEGAAFLSDGSVLIGLRWPVHETGRPLVAVLQGVPEWVGGGDLPAVSAVHVLDAVGTNGRLAGIRDLAVSGGRLHVVTGNIDSRDKGSILLEDHPEGADTVNTHFRCALPAVGEDQELDCELVREFPELPRIEGLAAEHGFFFYVSDEDEGVDMRLTRFAIASGDA